MKEEKDEEKYIILLDFAENYHFIVQDKVQEYHWNKDQCTFHPAVIFYKNQQNQLVHKSICIFSEDLDLDTSFVHKLQRLVCNFIQETLSQIKHFEYWSDGCAGQCKNFKNLMNLCNHVNGFGFHAIWSFFTTSHGKSPYDSIGGTVKRKIAQASLQRPVTNKMLTFKAVEEFCKENIVGITFFSIYLKDMVQVREVLNARYSLGNTVPGNRSCHHFEPSSTTLIKGKQLSDEHMYTIKDHSSSALPTASEIVSTLKPNDYATCIFYGFW